MCGVLTANVLEGNVLLKSASDHETGLRVLAELFVCFNGLHILLWLILIKLLSGCLGK
jgi:hypothetical protein